MIGAVGRVVGDAFLISLGRYSQILVTLATLPIIARQLGVERTGELGVGLGFVFIGSIVVDFGLTQILAARHGRGGLSLDVVVGYRRFRLALIVGLGSVGLLALLATGGNDVVLLAVLGVVAGGVSSLNEDWAYIGARQFGRMAAFQMIGRGGYVMIVLPCIIAISEPWVPLVALLVSNLLVCYLSRQFAAVPRDTGNGGLDLRVTLLRRGATIMGSRLMAVSYGAAAVVSYAALVSDRTLGLFSSADRVIRAGQSALDAFALAMLPRAARSHMSANFDMRKSTLTTFVVAGALGAASAAVLFLASPFLVPLIFGSEFEAAIPYFQVQALMLPATAVTSALMTTNLFIIEDSRGIFICSCVGAGAFIAALAVIANAQLPMEVSLAAVFVEVCVCGAVILRCLYNSRAGRPRAMGMRQE